MTNKTYKFQKRLSQEYITKFSSPHKNNLDCAVCALDFLNVLPKQLVNDMIEEVKSQGVIEEDIINYFTKSYNNNSFYFEKSEPFKRSTISYRIDYIFDYLTYIKENTLPGYVRLLGFHRAPPAPGHFVVIGKDMNGSLILFNTTQHNSDTCHIETKIGHSDIIEYIVRQDFTDALLLKSDVLDNHSKINFKIPTRIKSLKT